jgi:hypothetical protein
LLEVAVPPSRSVRVALLTFCLLATGAAWADEPEKTSEAKAAEADAKKFQAYAKEAAAAYEIKLRLSADGAAKVEDRKAVLIDKPILRWTNPLGGRRAHGEVFLWTAEGRPAAVLSLYEYTAPDGVVHEHHEFCSLATSPLATAGPGGRDWSPGEAGITPAPLPGAPVPAGSPRQRLSQMRELAGRFAAKKTTRAGETRALRLLSQPVHRFESESQGVSDGALFAFVEATDPEAFLIVEARTVEGKPQWHYGLTRMNSIRLVALLDDKQVWHADQLPWSQALNRKDRPYTAFQVK